MAFSYTQEIGDGVTTSYTFSFAGQDEGYIRESDIVALVDGVETPFTLTSSNTLEFSSAPANGATIYIRRVMPKNLPYSDFSRGNNFGPEILNNSFLQSLYIIHEALDGWFPEGFQFLTTVGFADDVTFNGFNIDNVGTLTADDIVIGPLSLSAEGILTEAYNWAQYPVDGLVPEGNGVDEYSAYHYSVKAEGSADAAAISESNAAASESAAATSESNAATSETNAANSASAAATSESNAATSETNAANSAAAAATSESNAATSETNAANSASAAATSETNAANSASAAATSETNAAQSESNAAGSETASYNWAEYPEDSPVPEGNGTEFSSHHWANKAEGWAKSLNTPNTEVIATGTTEGRILRDRFADQANVKDYGAVGDGIADDTLAFEAAAKNAPAGKAVPRPGDVIQKPDVVHIYLPPGEYRITYFLDVGGREVIWVADPAAKVPNFVYLNGKFVRQGQRITDGQHTGALDSACTWAVLANQSLEEPAGILGLIRPEDLSAYLDRDTVAAFASNRAPALVAQINSATYTGTSVILGTPMDANQVKRMRIGMIVDTQHSTKYSGFVTGWAADGSSINVSGWYLGDGIAGGGTAVTPPDGPGVYVNPFTKAWAHNANVFLENDSHADDATGFELGVFNNKAPYNPATQSPRTWGYDCVNLGSHIGETAFIQRGTFFNGFESRAATGYAYIAKNIDQIYPSEATFCSKTSSGTQFLIQSAAYQEKTSFSISRDGNIEAGRTDAASPVVFDFHSSGEANRDFDARILVGGGGGADGQGAMRIYSNSVHFSSGFYMDNTAFRPLNDNLRNLGTSVTRWNTLYATNGSINTSDRNRKQDIRSLDDKEMAVAIKLKGMIKAFRFKDSVESKGDEARIHFGVIAQEVGEAFEEEGLDPHKYALYCVDETENGLIYGIRYSELLAFIISAL